MGWVTGGEKELTQTIGRRVKVNQRQREKSDTERDKSDNST